MSFFDRYDRFRDTSTTDTRGERLDYRHRALITRNRAVIEGRRVLDLASHDGRWSFAALCSGASHVTGVEGKPYLVDNARETFAHYEVPAERHRLLVGDCLTTLPSLPRGAFDTVLCFGFLYHTLHHYDLLRGITALGPSVLLIDSVFVLDERAAIVLGYDDHNLEGAALPESTSDERTLVGIPTPRGLQVMLEQLGWHSRFLPNPEPATPQWQGVTDYQSGRRKALVAWRRGQPDPLQGAEELVR
jgi:2-polyprenyl-3-methyl-5-hydroxy-6-metoxy-1,4-benzoquinol methylase